MVRRLLLAAALALIPVGSALPGLPAALAPTVDAAGATAGLDPFTLDGVVLLPNQGPDVPGLLEVATVAAFSAELYVFTAGIRTHDVALPEVAWNRVFVEYHSRPNHPGGDPWDRTCAVFIAGTEVLHCTTTRGEFSVTEDVTEYASLLSGPSADVGTYLDSWADAGILVDVTLHFYADPVNLGDAPAATLVSPFTFAGLGGPGSILSTTVSFPASTPSRAVVELFTSGHTQEGEFWWLEDPTTFPQFGIFVDGERIGTVLALPYLYALLGFSGGTEAELINQAMWTPAQIVEEAAGVGVVSGKIPAYRAELPADLLPLLTGARTVEVVKETHGGSWPTSVTFLLD